MASPRAVTAAPSAAVTNTDSVQPCRLLTLPGELKNEIYRLVTVTSDADNPIVLTSTGFERSALFLTCKEIHDEAIKIYLLENHFHHEVVKYQSAPLVNFHRLCEGFLKEKQQKDMKFVCSQTVPTEYGDEDHDLWENLLDYLHNFYEDKLSNTPARPADIHSPPDVADIHTLLEHTIGTMFMLAGEGMAESWKDLQDFFECMRPTLIVTNKAWARNSGK